MSLLRYFAIASLLLGASSVYGQVTISGKLNYPKSPGSSDTVPLTAVHCFAARDTQQSETVAFRSWETAPAGWYKLSGMAGRYSLMFASPGSYLRPHILQNVYATTDVARDITPRFDYALFDDSGYDTKAANGYYQTFVAQGTSATSVGFRLVHDGVDGIGPGSQNFLVSIHRLGKGAPDTWEQVGPTAVAVDVDCGGPKNYAYSVGWNSGMVPLKPGETYAVKLRTEKDGGTFQTHWKEVAGVTGCYRVGKDATEQRKEALWLAVGTDCDGLVIPYNKRVHRQFNELTSCRRVWSQTYIAKGKSLAGVQIYAAVSGAQPSMMRQRVTVRVREGGPDGKVVGRERLSIGIGNYTGDASWGCFGTVFNPGDVPLTPGKKYAIEWESHENFETLHGFVNIKNVMSDDKPGLNPYRKHARDEYADGTAYLEGKDMGYDLDAQIIEYETAERDEPLAVDAKNLLANGDMQKGEPAVEKADSGKLDAWQVFKINPETTTQYIVDREKPENRFARVIGGSFNKTKPDGGFVQQVTGLSRGESYRLSGRVRSTWPASDQHQCLVGIDPTGQTDDPKSSTITWKLLPEQHGVFVSFTSDPIRPTKDGKISVWLRGRTTLIEDYPFRADFDDFSLARVKTEVGK